MSVRLVGVDVDRVHYELHPQLTVLRAAPAGVVEAVTAATTALAAGRAPREAGRLEVHGVVLELDAVTSELLGLDTVPAEARGVVRAADLPGGDRPEVVYRWAELDERERHMRADLAAAEVAMVIAGRRRAADAVALAAVADGSASAHDAHDAAAALLEGARERRDEAVAAATAADEAVEEAKRAHAATGARAAAARRRLAEAVASASLAFERLETARGSRDVFAGVALAAATGRLVALKSAPDGGDDDPGASLDDAALAAEIARLDAQRSSLAVSLLALDSADTFTVRLAIEEAVRGGTAVSADDDAIVLADELERALAEPGPDHAGDDSALADAGQLVAARRRRDDARVTLALAEQRARVPEVSPADRHRVEQAHNEVLQLTERVDRRVGGREARERLDAARATEQAVLDELGFVTYSDFLLRSSTTTNGGGKPQRVVEAAAARLNAAELEVADLEARVGAELALIERRAQRRALLDRAATVLGRPADERVAADLVWDLRAVQVERSRSAERIRRALAAAGLVVEADGPDEELVELARFWLEEVEESGADREEMETELEAVEVELAGLRRAQRERVEEPEAATAAARAARSHRRVEEAQRAVDSAVGRVEANAAIEATIGDLRASLERAVTAEAAAAAERDEAVAAQVDAAFAVRDAVTAAASAAAALAAAEVAVEAASAEAAAVEAAIGTEPDLLVRALAEAEAAEDAAQASHARLLADLIVAAEERASLAASSGPLPTVDAFEWALLSQVAAHRDVTYAGSLPVVVDGVLDAIPDVAAVALLERLEQLAPAVQVVVVTGRADLEEWAGHAGPERAGVLRTRTLTLTAPWAQQP